MGPPGPKKGALTPRPPLRQLKGCSLKPQVCISKPSKRWVATVCSTECCMRWSSQSRAVDGEWVGGPQCRGSGLYNHRKAGEGPSICGSELPEG